MGTLRLIRYVIQIVYCCFSDQLKRQFCHLTTGTLRLVVRYVLIQIVIVVLVIS